MSTPNSPTRPALFLDRDGVLNEDPGYVHRWEDFHWIPGAREAVAAFNAAGWWVFVVTNQSGVGRGYYAEDDVIALHAKMSESLGEIGARIAHERARRRRSAEGDRGTRRRLVDAAHFGPVLGGQGRDHGSSKAAQGHDCLEVRLDARAAAGIRTGNDEDARHAR